ncbi:signal recognition particle-docking protein FtsY [Kushneria phosphatilytica]|uniref:Signal recognition particle receptor FtsY n=1 Tax=Kushneria phosphatilytica TaxID=657387 RepID=A0A1S1NVU4_9GAMM|nr:signal recognition particle-docking protein FtsY [Kushneria phosphatilytica]OHV10902.1 signal recognition particle-docking protein FtsY [Kushneria phosphatilytica]QEL12012.1 signal recognition particle-docking protein FtsY [Kushneria phosphatilytica]
MFGFLKRRKHNQPPRDEEQTAHPSDEERSDAPAESDEQSAPEEVSARQQPVEEHIGEDAVEDESAVAEPEQDDTSGDEKERYQQTRSDEARDRSADIPEPQEAAPEPAPGLQPAPEDVAASEDVGVASTADAPSSTAEPALRPGERRSGKPRDDEIEVGPETADDAQSAPRKQGWLRRMRQGLGKTRANLTDNLSTLLLGHKEIDDDLLEELETQLLLADVGVEATTEIMTNLEARISRRELKNVEALYEALQEELSNMLEPVAKTLKLPPKGEGPFVILMVGVNGVGKTTTIGKLTQRFQRQGRSVMLAAGDTFRAAAVEQLKVWGERNEVPVVAQHTGADSASVIYDALSSAKARGIDVLIADTAGRLQNKGPLMEELKKVQRVMARLDEQAPHEVMLVLDAGTGQNAISQAQTFHEAVPITGITLTKLDGTAKGGIIFAVAKQLGIPIRYIGVGETLDDLRPFEARDFVGALFSRERE